MAKTKTSATSANVEEFINSVADTEQKRKDSHDLLKFMQDTTGHQAKMWGPSIVGFGSYHYKYDSGHEGDAPLAAFAPRKDSLVIYFSTEFKNRELLLSQLGKHRSSKACVYVKKLSDIDLKILETMIVNSMTYTTKLYPSKNHHNP